MTSCTSRSGYKISMEIIAFILFVIAAVLFLISGPAFHIGGQQYNGIPLGLALLTIGFIVQFCTTARQVTFH